MSTNFHVQIFNFFYIFSAYHCHILKIWNLNPSLMYSSIFVISFSCIHLNLYILQLFWFRVFPGVTHSSFISSPDSPSDWKRENVSTRIFREFQDFKDFQEFQGFSGSFRISRIFRNFKDLWLFNLILWLFYRRRFKKIALPPHLRVRWGRITSGRLGRAISPTYQVRCVLSSLRN